MRLQDMDEITTSAPARRYLQVGVDRRAMAERLEQWGKGNALRKKRAWSDELVAEHKRAFCREQLAPSDETIVPKDLLVFVSHSGLPDVFPTMCAYREGG